MARAFFHDAKEVTLSSQVVQSITKNKERIVSRGRLLNGLIAAAIVSVLVSAVVWFLAVSIPAKTGSPFAPIRDLCAWIAATRVGTGILESVWVFPIIEGLHLMGIALSIGVLCWLDFRLIGVASGQESDPAHARNELAHKLEALAGKVIGLERQPRDVATRPRQTFHQATSDRVSYRSEYDRNDRGRLFGRYNVRARVGDQHIDLQLDEFGGQRRRALETPFRPSILDRNGTAVDPAQFTQPLNKGVGLWG